ncbi:MAG: VCBS repeat-containing protein [bacterium]|nr:VCBS repeat-containing protein [bacterium]
MTVLGAIRPGIQPKESLINHLAFALGSVLLPSLLLAQAPGCPGAIFESVTTVAMTGNNTAVALADLNGDGSRDLVVAEDDNQLFATQFHIGVRLNTGAGQFGPEVRFPTTGRPQDLAVADFDGDGNLDVVVTSPATSQLKLFLGDGLGGLALSTTIAAGGWNGHVELGDFNEDGNVDVATPGGSRIYLALGNGAGGFFVTSFATPIALARGIAVDDIDGDGHQDLAVVDIGSDQVFVYEGTGNATFIPVGSFGMGTSLRDLALGDLDGDGRPELACANNSNDRVAIRAFVGAPWFGPLQFHECGSLSSGVAVVDVDQDGNRDVIVCNSNSVTVLRGDGVGGLPDVTGHPANGSPVAVVSADVDDDGLPDIVTANQSASSTILLGRGDRSFRGPVRIRSGQATRDLAVADMNRDGIDDVVVSQADAFVSVVHGGQMFPVATQLVASTSGARGLIVADLERDGHVDVVLQHYFGVEVHRANGVGGFLPAVTVLTGPAPSGLWAGDFDRNGLVDLVACDSGLYSVPPTITILMQSSAAVWSSSTLMMSAQDVCVVDADGDGFEDLVAVREFGSLFEIRRGNGDGTFQQPTAVAGTVGARAVTTGDINEDGYADFLVCDFSNGRVQVVLGNGTVAPVPLVPLTNVPWPIDAAIADLDHDGRMDLAVAQGNGSVKATRFFRGDGTGGFVLARELRASGVPQAIVATDLDDDGNSDVVVANGNFGGLTLHPNGCRALALALDQAGVGGTLRLRDSNLEPGVETWNLISLEPCPGSPGSGPPNLLGLCASTAASRQFLIDQLVLPLGTVPFHFVATSEQLDFGPIQSAVLLGLTMEGVAFQWANNTLQAVSAVQRLTVR